MIVHELERVACSRRVDSIVLATSDDASDDELARVVMAAGYAVYRGSLADVLGRYHDCAAEHGAEHVVRITGDCPLIDPAVVDEVIARHLAVGADYTSNTLGTETYPDGLDCEVVTMAALERAHSEARLASEREHVTPYIRSHAELFTQEGVRYAGASLGAERWTVDEPADFAFVTRVYEALYPARQDFSMEDVLALLASEPDLRALNAGFTRNEGLAKSLAEDRFVR